MADSKIIDESHKISDARQRQAASGNLGCFRDGQGYPLQPRVHQPSCGNSGRGGSRFGGHGEYKANLDAIQDLMQPDFKLTINRSSIVLQYRQPFLDWIRTVEPEFGATTTLDSLNEDGDAFIAAAFNFTCTKVKRTGFNG